MSQHDTVYGALRLQSKDFAFGALGIDYKSRTRHKISGIVTSWQLVSALDARVLVKLECRITKSCENCPKYITSTDLQVNVKALKLKSSLASKAGGEPLDTSALAMINGASGVMLATCRLESNTVSVNHRGGVAGFVRASADGLALHLPDYSGDRYYGSLGNIVADGVASLTFSDFTIGDMLYVCGMATIMSGDEALAIMPRVKMLIKLDVKSYTHVSNAHPLRSSHKVTLSPYNPPLKLLTSE